MQGLLLLFCSQAAWKLSRRGAAGVTFRGEFTDICFPTLPSFISSSLRGRLPRRWWVRAPDPAPCQRAIVQTSACEMEALCCCQVKGFSTKAGEPLLYSLWCGRIDSFSFSARWTCNKDQMGYSVKVDRDTDNAKSF